MGVTIAQRVSVGHDNRRSSRALYDAVMEGLSASGCAVMDVGLVATPILYWHATFYGGLGGLMVTGSHLPPDQNGFKLCVGNRPIFDGQIKVIRSSPFEKDRRRIVIDVDHMMRTGDTSRNVLLQPNDILYVPPTPLGWLGLRVQEILFPFQPIIQGYTFPARVMDLEDTYNGDNNN